MSEHQSKTDKVLLRAKDMALIISIIVLAGYIIKGAASVSTWDTAAKRIDDMAPIVSDLVTESIVTKRMNELILQRLDRIDRKLDRGRGGD